MPIIGWWKQNAVPRRKRTYALLGLALVVALAAGYLAGALRERSRHAATAEVLVGTVVMSNEGSRWIIFYPDGVVPPQNDAEWMYYVIADGWQDASGTFHEDGTYPTCLVVVPHFEYGALVDAASPRVELTTIDWDNGTQRPMHVALRVRCLG